MFAFGCGGQAVDMRCVELGDNSPECFGRDMMALIDDNNAKFVGEFGQILGACKTLQQPL